ncbi:MAG: DEAD/DEAH box helicase [Burkholderiales bacterium]|nr:DEAD/DEAH box helicase [Burkholderiales bacterium]
MSDLTLTRPLIRSSFDGTTLDRGIDYARNGRVRNARRLPDGARFEAHVEGSGPLPYEVTVTLLPGKPRPRIYGLCTCPMHINCKHVVATLWSLADDGSDDDAPPERKLRPATRSIPAAAPPRPPKTELPFELRHWIGTAPAPESDSAPDGAKPVSQAVFYLLGIRVRARTPALQVSLVTARRIRSGGFGKASAWHQLEQSIHAPQPYLTPEDRTAMRLLRASGTEVPGGIVVLGTEANLALNALLATGRCHWNDRDTPALSLGEPRPGVFSWQLGADGQQRIAVDTVPPAERTLPVTPPWYVATEDATCGPVTSDLPPEIVQHLLAAPPIPPDHVERTRAALLAMAGGRAIPLPAVPRIVEVRDARPTPVLHLSTWIDDYAYGRYRDSLQIAALRFEYDGVQIDQDSPGTITVMRDGEVRRIRRSDSAEKKAHATLVALGMTRLSELARPSPPAHRHAYTLPHDSRWIDFVGRQAGQLQDAGWRIEYEEGFAFTPAQAGAWHADIQPLGVDGFELGLGIDVDGTRVDLVALLGSVLRTHPELLATDGPTQPGDPPLAVRLPDGRILPIPLARIRPMVDVLRDLLEQQPVGRLKLSRMDALRLRDLDATGPLEWQGGTDERALAERLAGFERLEPATIPEGFGATLRGYQQLGVSWLQFLRTHGLGGILADDMGLGKTVQALAHVLIEKRSGRLTAPVLVVAPTSVMPNWKAEIARFAPELKVHVSHGLKRRSAFDAIGDADLVLTTYPLLARDEEALRQHRFHAVILDEAQQIKNAATRAARVVGRLDAGHRICLTGTPLENHLGELWSLFAFLMPGLLGDATAFRRGYRTPIEKHGDGARLAQLVRRIRPFLLRRTKEQVATELPPKTEIVRSIELDGPQRDLYETVRAALQAQLRAEIAARGLARSQIAILDALLKLRQVCCDPRLVKIDSARKVKGSAKLETLLDMLEEMLGSGRRILLFSQFTSMLALIESELQARGIGFVKLTGDTRDRAKPVKEFQTGKVPLFLISLKAGGTGLNLTAADTVIHYDPWWNPAVENQATDRAHRIGQDKPVFVYKLIVAGSVEERIMALQASKAALAKSILEGTGDSAAQLTAEDVDALLEPLQ